MSEDPVSSSRLPALVHFSPLSRIKRQKKEQEEGAEEEEEEKIGDG